MKAVATTVKKKNYLIPIIIATVIIVLAVLWYLGSLRDISHTGSTTTKTAAVSNVGRSKATTVQKSSSTTTPSNTSSDNGNTATNTKANATSTDTDSSTTGVTITSVQNQANTVSVSAYASTVVSNGTCTFTFTLGKTSFYKNTPTSPSASTSSCATLTLNNSDFPSSGTWQLVVGFNSGNITGSSTQTPVVIK